MLQQTDQEATKPFSGCMPSFVVIVNLFGNPWEKGPDSGVDSRLASSSTAPAPTDYSLKMISSLAVRTHQGTSRVTITRVHTALCIP